MASVEHSGTDPVAAPASAEPRLHGVDLVRQLGLSALLKEDFEVHLRRASSPGFWALAVYRFGTWSRTLRNPVTRRATRVLYQTGHTFVRNFCGIEMSDSVRVGRRLKIAHQNGIVIHSQATIGDDCLLRQNVTFGVGVGTDVKPGEGPVIGDRVSFGVGSVVLGNVTIGSDVNIGPNCTVGTNIPSQRTVFMPQPRVLPLRVEKSPEPGTVNFADAAARRAKTADTVGQDNVQTGGRSESR